MTRVTLLFAVLAVGLLTACDSIQPTTIPRSSLPTKPRVLRPNLSPGPIPSVPSGAPLLTVTYYDRVETATIRGSCPVGLVPLTTYHPSPAPESRCVYDSFSTDPIVAQVGVAYPFELANLHCGLGYQQFDHALFITRAASLSSSMLAGFGTMTLVDPYQARYHDRTGVVVDFVAVASVHALACA